MDRVEAQNNIDLYKNKIRYPQQYNHTYSSAVFIRACNDEIRTMKDCVRVLEEQLGK